MNFEVMSPALTSEGNGSRSDDKQLTVSKIRSIRRFVEKLKECSHSRDLKKGRQLHSQAIHKALAPHAFVSSALINMYGKCRSLEEARSVFDKILHPDTVCWNCLIQSYVENGQSATAVELFDQMEKTCTRDSRSYVAALSACSTLASDQENENHKTRWLKKGESIHRQAVDSGCFDTIVGNSSIDMFSNCGDMSRARNVFDSIHTPTIVSWTSLIRGYALNGECELALKLFDSMEKLGHGPSPDARTFVAALTACATLAAKSRRNPNPWLEKGENLHSRASKSSCTSNPFVKNALIDMYSKLGKMNIARSIFDGMKNRDAISWTILLQGYVDNGEGTVALDLFDKMETSPSPPSARIFVAALTACASLATKPGQWLERGRSIHSRAVKRRLADNIYVQNTLVDMYSKLGDMQQAREVFEGMVNRSVVSWTALLRGYIEKGENELALKLFDAMGDELPSARTYVVALTACTNLAAARTRRSTEWLARGKTIFLRAASRGCSDIYVETAAINLYAKCDRMVEAGRVFNSMAVKNVVSWTCMIQGYADNREYEVALELLACMDLSGFQPNSATFVAALSACGSLMAFSTGQTLHGEIQCCGLDKEVVVATCLVEFYSSCGNMDAALEVFELSPVKDVCSWNALMAGYSQLGDVQTLELFHRMRELGLAPDEFTFTHVLSACNHAGLTEVGRECFESMSSRYGVSPNVIHYNCMVDLLARANHLDEALEMVRGMPFEANVVTWTAILGGCRKWKNVEAGKVAYEALMRLNNKDIDDSTFVLMANIYGSSSCQSRVKQQENVLEWKRGVCVDENVSRFTWWTDAAGKAHRFQSQG